MKNYYFLLILILVILSLALIGYLSITSNKNKATSQNNSNSIFTAEKFCIAKGENNISSAEAYELALKSDCAQAGIVKEDCDCDSKSFICSFTVKAEKSGCNPICLVDLKTQKAQMDWRCVN
ncbi:MAG: hypothetical protein A3B89_00045 [Candidatus Buchananbacteria bacterium RIFCSPHIGHO2_02_FULL_40_13]|uniref:Transmembrane protein n=1 Tax=Candidatus Buchananbacteria bacterium RIFCSPLOWO2_01_FULL_39_33 TaxID=1797543 RepID=A0A1G1YPB7_9BACT|nr:MAG: hypothetical protein A2820_03270 [Candidatus Buchananbacteria bacterium RIFCSPHIGHO2_01_FULL_40_35]OGY51167.1 MAG: hypothetical protein A3B89_00045 [Candidatus Buchananbacteria bacterium RIFCSPHIGHO2_02_FULL_40_13]OGY53287.1 MAG: hypothetical protein A3A02_03300 [Candidatus Buchananbacteria bacterium RIFCSPLOWO2_01_FULL_39_33]